MLIMLFVYQQLQEFPDSPNFYLPIKLSFNVGLNILIIFKNEKKKYNTTWHTFLHLFSKL